MSGGGFASLDEEAKGGEVAAADTSDMAAFWGGSSGTIADLSVMDAAVKGESIQAAPIFDDPVQEPEDTSTGKPSHKRRRYRILHHLVAHPLLVLAPKVGLRVHAYSCRKLYGERGEDYLTAWWQYQV